jgi:NAD(P)-dependent dehydrogenase (short-subunit alcohol dehydrogenase family)
MLLFTVELADRLKGTRVTANAVHPGVVRTQMMLRAPGFFRVAAYLALPFALSPQRGAATSIYLACSPEVKDASGKYLRGAGRRISRPLSTRRTTAISCGISA